MNLIESARLRPDRRRQRSSSWDRTGGNVDADHLAPGGELVLLDVRGPGVVRHVWCTLQVPNLHWARDLELLAWWDGAGEPSIAVPLGDFFGVGNGIAAEFDSAGLSIAPRDGTALHCWLPMPFADGARIVVRNPSPLPVIRLYFQVDWEAWEQPDPDLGRLHAAWSRSTGPSARPADGVYAQALNPADDGNHLFADIEGAGQYIGTVLSVHNADGGWYGEGDDMFRIDGEPWPVSVHGTGTEDYVGTAWSPTDRFHHLRYGQPLAETETWDGFSTIYRWHHDDPIGFTTGLRASIERGHANDRADDFASVAYWYGDQARAVPALPPMLERRPPWPPRWQARAEALERWFLDQMAGGGELQLHHGLAAVVCVRALARWDAEAADRALAGMGMQVPPAQQPTPAPLTRRAMEGEPVDLDELLSEWAAAIDTERLARADTAIGFELDGQLRRFVVRGGKAWVTVEPGPERIRLTGTAQAMARIVARQDEALDAAIRGDLGAMGDADLGFSVSRWFLLAP